VTELGALNVRPQGPATAGIWLTMNGSHFPMIGWNDFVVVVLGWWMAAIVRLLQNESVIERIDFMHGPYAVEISRMKSGRFQLRTFAGPDGGHEVAVGEAAVKAFVSELSIQSQKLLDECRLRGWWSPNAEDLKSDYARFQLDASAPIQDGDLPNKSKWKTFELRELFDIKKGKRLTKANMTEGLTPFIGAIDNNNGLTAFIGQPAIHKANTITVNYNGNGVAGAFYQPKPFWCSDDVNVLYPKFTLTPAVALFIAAIIRLERYRFNYGRKWHLERMTTAIIRLPSTPDGTPDWQYIEGYIKSLPFSSQIEEQKDARHTK